MSGNSSGVYAGLGQLAARVPTPAAAFPGYHPSITQAALEFHRAQLYDYNARLHFGLRAYPGTPAIAYPGHHDGLPHPFFQARYDPRARLLQEEPKPQHSYIGLLAMSILSSKDRKMVLSDIYQWILDNYAYFRNRAPGWRNSIRHNLSLNDCFIKSGRSANGKGHYWAIHPANIEDFKKGDFRRRKAQRRVRKAMGLAVPDDEDSPSPPPPPGPETAEWRAKMAQMEEEEQKNSKETEPPTSPTVIEIRPEGAPGMPSRVGRDAVSIVSVAVRCTKRRTFDMASLLAPDDDEEDSSEHPAKIPRLEIPQTHSRLGITEIKDDRDKDTEENKDEEDEIDVDSNDDDDRKCDFSITHSADENNTRDKFDSSLHRDADEGALSPRSDVSPAAKEAAASSPIYTDRGSPSSDNVNTRLVDSRPTSASTSPRTLGSTETGLRGAWITPAGMAIRPPGWPSSEQATMSFDT